MRKKRKWIILLVSFVLILPFWWGLNALAKDANDFFFLQEIKNNSEINSAEADQKITVIRLKKLKKELIRQRTFKNLKISAKEAISVEINKGVKTKILFEKNSQVPLPIASLTKLTTALVVFENYDLSKKIKISKEAVDQEGSSKWGNLREGEYLSVKNLLYMALLESSNDAAFSLTEPFGEKKFVGLMNKNAEKIGLENTKFFNPTGLEPDNPNGPINHSTAKDLVKLSRYISENYPQIFKISSQQSYTVLRPNGNLHHFIPENTDKLLGKIPGIIGGKTGWSPRASGCLLVVLKNPNGSGYFVNVVLGSNDRFGDMKKIIKILTM